MLNDPRLLNVVANTLTVAAVLALFGGMLFWLAHRPYFSVSQVRLAPLQAESLAYVSAATVQASLSDRLRGSFFTIDLDQVRRWVEGAPWVRQARVQREWPDTLQIQIEEQQPLALWNEDQMINTWGEAFRASQEELPDDVALPRLHGPDDAERLVVQRYAELANRFADMGLRVEEVELSARYAWEVRLSNGVRVLLGRDPGAEETDPHGRPGAQSFAERVDRFVRSWPELMRRLDGQQLTSVDLRYPDGYAITLAPLNNNERRKP